MRSNHFIFLDDVQFQKRSWQQRNKIRVGSDTIWLTVPVLTKGKFEQQIKDVRISADKDWRSKHLKTIEMAYSKAPYFNSFFPIIERIYQFPCVFLAELNIFAILEICEFIGLEPKISRSSQISTSGSNSDKILNLCKKEHANSYFTGASGKNYLILEDFNYSGIEVEFQNFFMPKYQQIGHSDFIPNLSIIDVGFNLARSKILDAIQ